MFKGRNVAIVENLITCWPGKQKQVHLSLLSAFKRHKHTAEQFSLSLGFLPPFVCLSGDADDGRLWEQEQECGSLIKKLKG